MDTALVASDAPIGFPNFADEFPHVTMAWWHAQKLELNGICACV